MENTMPFQRFNRCGIASVIAIAIGVPNSTESHFKTG
jgi:hypothetical protein